MTPERDRMAERERSRLQRLDMTGTDERRSSRSHSGTPSRGDNFVPQPVFQSHPGSHSHSGTAQDLPVPTALAYPPQMQGVEPSVMPVDDDPFRIYVPEHPGIVNLNDDIPEMQNAPQWVANIQGPLSQEGRNFQWQLPIAPIQLPIPGPSQQLAPVPSHPPARVVAGVRHAAASVTNTARQPHPQYPTKLWCTKGSHWVESNVFGRLLTCEACRAAVRARRARARDEQLAQEAQVLAQLQIAAQIDVDGPQNPPVNNPPPPPSPPPDLPQAPVDPLSAISPEDKILLENCRNKLMSVVMESCNLCHEEWFDLDVKNGACANCRKGSKFQPQNNMYPGDGASHLPELTQMEEMLISPVHALVQLWQIRGGFLIEYLCYGPY